ncbi:MAG: MmcQ/YjbR family DNA-binding protein, partial [Clostridia bacterium]|nr:MmcQ/YjbR family DNA-binding protein [Clostridia bacterium]
GSLIDGEHIFPGYHMNKEHWISVLMDGSVPTEQICWLVDMSYQMTKKG